MRVVFRILLLAAWLISCSGSKKHELSGLSLALLDGGKAKIGEAISSGPVVFVFLSPECPLCINYTRTMTQLESRYQGHELTFFSVFPGTYYTEKEILDFETKYNFDFPAIMDPEFKLTELLNATVTPEAVLVSNEGVIKYSGAIDNWAFETGQKKLQATKHYLSDAIQSVLAGKPVITKRTEPKGCYIE